VAIEQNGINVIGEAERKGHARGLFWPWCAANISVLGISFGSFLLGFGISFKQALIAGVAGTVLSFLLVGFVSLAGKHGSAPTMVLSRAAFGVRGNAAPAFISWLLLVGWETVLVALATLATTTVFGRLGWGNGNGVKSASFMLVAAVVVLSGVIGFDLIMRLQAVLTVALAVLTAGYVLLTMGHIQWQAVAGHPAGSLQSVIGAFVFAVTGFGLGWVNSASDYSRYLPRSVPGAGVIAWPTFGASLAPVLLIAYGLLLAASDPALAGAIAADPIGALTTLLPAWYLLPFAGVAIGGIIGGAVLDIYSSGLVLLTLGLRVRRWQAALIDGILMILGTIVVVWLAENFIGPFQGFLITLGVPIAAWCGIFLGDMALRRSDYADEDLFDARGRYGSANPVAVGALVAGTALGWGLVTNTAAPWLSWQGYLLGPLGLGGREGVWAYANLGVLAALALGFLSQWLFSRKRVQRQERPSAKIPGAEETDGRSQESGVRSQNEGRQIR
jgi:nucleobase:cation symporter-1, NCS1 family